MYILEKQKKSMALFFHVISIPPTFVYSPGLSNNYSKLINFE